MNLKLAEAIVAFLATQNIHAEVLEDYQAYKSSVTTTAVHTDYYTDSLFAAGYVFAVAAQSEETFLEVGGTLFSEEEGGGPKMPKLKSVSYGAHKTHRIIY